MRSRSTTAGSVFKDRPAGRSPISWSSPRFRNWSHLAPGRRPSLGPRDPKKDSGSFTSPSSAEAPGRKFGEKHTSSSLKRAESPPRPPTEAFGDDHKKWYNSVDQ